MLYSFAPRRAVAKHILECPPLTTDLPLHFKVASAAFASASASASTAVQTFPASLSLSTYSRCFSAQALSSVSHSLAISSQCHTYTTLAHPGRGDCVSVSALQHPLAELSVNRHASSVSCFSSSSKSSSSSSSSSPLPHPPSQQTSDVMKHATWTDEDFRKSNDEEPARRTAAPLIFGTMLIGLAAFTYSESSQPSFFKSISSSSSSSSSSTSPVNSVPASHSFTELPAATIANSSTMTALGDPAHSQLNAIISSFIQRRRVTNEFNGAVGTLRYEMSVPESSASGLAEQPGATVKYSIQAKYSRKPFRFRRHFSIQLQICASSSPSTPLILGGTIRCPPSPLFFFLSNSATQTLMSRCVLQLESIRRGKEKELAWNDLNESARHAIVASLQTLHVDDGLARFCVAVYEKRKDIGRQAQPTMSYVNIDRTLQQIKADEAEKVTSLLNSNSTEQKK